MSPEEMIAVVARDGLLQSVAHPDLAAKRIVNAILNAMVADAAEMTVGFTTAKVTFTCRTLDGQEHDVTDDVGALFDLITTTGDWCSELLSVEEAEPMVRIADLAGYDDPDATNPHRGSGPTILQQARAQVAAKKAADAEDAG